MANGKIGQRPAQGIKRKTGATGAAEMKSSGSGKRGRIMATTTKLNGRGYNTAQQNMTAGHHHAGNC